MKIVTGYDATSLFTSTDWYAYDNDTHDIDSPTGYGATMQEAVADLMEQIEDRAEYRRVLHESRYGKASSVDPDYLRENAEEYRRLDHE